MVGRDAELSELRRLVAGASRGRPGLTFVIGDAGIGKTRLVEALVSDVDRRSALVLRGHCMVEATRDVPLAPFVEALGDLRRSLGTDELEQLVQPWAEPLSRLLPALAVGAGDATGEPSRTQMIAAVVEVFRRAAGRRPVLLVLEDAHWADESSRVLLDYLARSLRDERLEVIVTMRSDDPGFERSGELLANLATVARVSSIELAPLSPGEIAQQVDGLRDGASVPDARLRRIVEASRGLPLLVEELVDTDPEDESAVADRLFGHRLSRLGPAARAVVDTLAVAVHDTADGELAIASALPQGEFDAALSEAVVGGVLVSRGGAVAFRHALLRDAALTSLERASGSRLTSAAP